MTHDQSKSDDHAIRTSMPLGVQRWLDRCLPVGLDMPSGLRIEQEGAMDIRGRWTPFTATGLYTATPLAFTWRARLHMLPGVWIVAEDGHRDGHGWGGARLWGSIPIGKRTGPEVLKSQLVRNLGELPWLPALALTDPSLSWTEDGDTAFEVRSTAGGQEARVRFELDAAGDIIRAFSPARPYDIPDGFVEAPWYYEFSEHCEFDGVRLPAAGLATFDKADGPWEYFRCTVTSVRRQ